jgi:structure-specific endonuclease subunit SLX1
MLYTDQGQTYIGATVDPDRRLRQHNQEISGGARATGMQVGRGQVWKRACYVVLPEWRTALQFEWRFKQLSRKLPLKMQPLERRLRALKQLLELPQSTSKAIPFKEWLVPPEVHCETEEADTIFHT